MYKVTFKFDVGTSVIDSISGIHGIVDANTIRISGNKQCSVQPRSIADSNKMEEAWFLDEDQLNTLPAFDGSLIKENTKEVTFKVSPGSKVKDLVTGISGTVILCTYWLNGCKKYTIQPKAKKGSVKAPPIHTCDEDYIELIEESIIEKVDTKKSPGGPALRSSSIK